MPEPRHLLYNLKWRLLQLEDALATVQHLIDSIKAELAEHDPGAIPQ